MRVLFCCRTETSHAGAAVGGGIADPQHAESESGDAAASRSHLRRERTLDTGGGHLAGDGQSKLFDFFLTI